jgi:hemolysin activation/secretion protein
MISLRDTHPRPFLLALPFCLFASGQALAQSAVLPPEADISRLRLDAPELPPAEDFDLTIRSPEKSVVPKDVSELEFLVSRVEVRGVTFFSDTQVRALFAGLEGQRIGLEALREQADRLQELYVNQGFLLTRVIVPPQRIENGVVTVEVVEGYISKILLEDDAATGGKMALAALSGLTGKRPLNIRELDGKLLILNDTPGLAVKTLLRPGQDLGSAEMVVATAPAPNQALLSVSNTGSSAIGPAIYSVGYSINAPLGQPGALDLSLSAAGEDLQELQAASVRYAMPVGSQGMIIYVGGLAAKAKPGGEAALLDVASTSYSLELRLRSPLLRSRSSALYLEAALLGAKTAVRALGIGLTKDNIVSSQIGLRGQHQSGVGQTTAHIFVTAGLPVFGALEEDTPNPSVPNFVASYRKVSGQLDHVLPVNRRFSLLTRVAGQWTDGRLLAGEQVAFGGPLLGRGYAPSALTGDRGVGVLGELRLDLPAARAPGLIGNVQTYAFADAAETKLLAARDIAAERQSIQSAGVGLRALLLDRLLLDVQFAAEGRKLPGGESRPARVNLSLVSVF